MNTKWIRALSQALPVAALLVAGNLAAEQEVSYPFQHYGVVDSAPDGQRMILISDTALFLSKDASIRSLSGKSASTSALSKGAKVGYNSHGAGSERFISEVWILPKNFDSMAFEGLKD